MGTCDSDVLPSGRLAGRDAALSGTVEAHRINFTRSYALVATNG
jgi:hypothetical protein